MPWQNDPEKRARDARVYGNPVYQRNRRAALARAGRRCEQPVEGRPCRSTDRVQVDHVTPVSQGGGHDLENLQVLCHRHHMIKTAQEGGGYRSAAAVGDPPLTGRTAWLYLAVQ